MSSNIKFLVLLASSKPEPNMLKVLPIIPYGTSQKYNPLLLFYSHIITYNYCHIVLYDYCFKH